MIDAPLLCSLNIYAVSVWVLDMLHISIMKISEQSFFWLQILWQISTAPSVCPASMCIFNIPGLKWLLQATSV